ncbi:MAG: hypothetical protein RIR51_1752 [Bacteroidota bacterium]|jgi:uncharacterized membrane protein
MAIAKRHIVKSITWRIIGSIDTLFLAYVFTGTLESGLKISGIEIVTKMILFYFHEKVWFNSKIKNPNKRHLIKTFTWRAIGTTDTVIISTIISGNPFTGLKIGGAETISKMVLYYLHEKAWYRLNFGLNRLRKKKKQRNEFK